MQSLNNMNVHVNVYITTLYLLIVICANGINCFQRFLEQPKYTEVNPGQDALLTCKVIDKRGTCSWQKDNKPVGIYAKKYEWAARPSSGNVALHLDLHPPPMQIGGDCSLWIRSATLDFDDGLWECQVTASDFTTQDALTSHPVRLVVRVAPQRPRLEYEGIHVPPGQNITADSGALTTVKCVSHYGNPPATLKWYLGEQELEPIHPQINNTEPDNPRTWSTTSVVQLTAMRERHGDILRCLAYHESYAAQTMSVEARLDVKYAPIIRLIGSPEHDLEEDRDALILRCVADANPPASIVWRRAGRSEIASLQETLQLRPVGRRDAGLYTCQAQNSVGTSEQLSVQLDVKYPPKIISAGPDRLTTAPLFSPAAFECIADGNPMPTYKWVQRISHGSTKFIERGQEPRLVIDNITYDHQGEYECRATSYINGQERVAVSEPVSLQVVGAPQVLRLHPSLHTVVVKRDEPASLTLVVCADPRPIRVAWEWGSLRLDAGTGIERFHADDMVPDSREDCFLSTLHIDHATEHDSRPYYLVVENERGLDRLAMHLNVDEPLEMSYLLGIACGCLAAVLILICLCIYAVRSKKCCFKGTSGYKSSDKDSEKADLKSRSNSTSAGTGPSTSTQADGVYTNPSVGFLSPTTASTLTQSHQPYASGLSSLGGLGVRDVSSLVGHHHGASSSPEAMKCTRAKTITTRRKSTAMQYNPSNLNMIDNMQSTEHLLWQEEANEFIKRYPQQRHSSSGISNKNNNNNCNKDAKQQEQFNRHSMNSGLVYTHPSAIAMMTLSKSGSDACLADADADDDAGLVGGMIVGNVVGNELLTARQRHQRDLFSGDLGIPPIPPPPPRTSFGQSQPLPHIAPRKRTHVGNVVHTFEAIALQRRLAAFKQQQLQQQQKSKQQQQQPSQQTFSKYFKSNNKFCKFKRQQQQQQQLKARIAHTEIKCNTFNERNKQIAQHYLNQMELDYRKNLFSSQMHTNVVNCNNNNNKHKIGANEQAEVGVVAVFDEMLAGYSATDDDDVANDNDVQITQNSTHVSIININGNEAQDNTLRINLENVNDKPTTVGRVQLKPATTMQRKKPAPPVPTNQLMAKVKTTDQIPTTTTTTIRSNTNKQHNKSRTNAQPFATANQNANHYKCTADIAVAHIDDASHDFLRGSTLSQSFVHQTKRQQKIKGKAPQPPQLPHTTFMPYGNSNNISNSTHCRISLANPFRHVLRFKSFDLLK